MKFTTVIVVLIGFTAFGTDYTPGDHIPQATADGWPEGTLARRLEGGFVKYAPVAASGDGEPLSSPGTDSADAENPLVHPEVLETYTKQQLVDFARSELGETGLSTNSTKADLLLAVKTLVAEHTQT